MNHLKLNMNTNKEMTLSIRDNDTQKVKPLMSASGYEKTLASLSLRIILNKINY